MNALQININVNLSLDERTVTFLREVVTALPADRPSGEEDMPEDVYNGTAEKPAQKPARKKSTKSEAKPEPAQDPAPAQEPEPAPEPEPKPEKVEEISDSTLREKVKAAKDRSGAKAVRDIFAEFGIGSSVECPQGRRSELVARLEKA